MAARTFDTFSITRKQASAVVSHAVGRSLDVTSMRPLAGGMINSVQCWVLSGPPHQCVVKLTSEVPEPAFEREARSLQLLLSVGFPCAAPLFVEASGGRFPFSALGLEYIPGEVLTHAEISDADRLRLELELAEVLSTLHSHTSEGFGYTDEEPKPRWIDVFRPRFAEVLRSCGDRNPETTTTVCKLAVARMDDLLGRRDGPARLIHGDMWAGNIIVRPGAERVLAAIVDASYAGWADPEYELAYMEGFGTVGALFLREYARVHPIDDGYELRRTLYNLYTMLIHVWLFGDDHYHARAARLAESLAGAMGWSV